ncbi:hypothetical protein GCM10010266_62350 [Streptomyces griseomycini]|nr:hypothetical protein GCM10010266_62350 [Streptomyces griseomycini]GGR50274.1 hypothetical protein GCM10015536_64870 [Streptomyces griseomycini]
MIRSHATSRTGGATAAADGSATGGTCGGDAAVPAGTGVPAAVAGVAPTPVESPADPVARYDGTRAPAMPAYPKFRTNEPW